MRGSATIYQIIQGAHSVKGKLFKAGGDSNQLR